MAHSENAPFAFEGPIHVSSTRGATCDEIKSSKISLPLLAGSALAHHKKEDGSTVSKIPTKYTKHLLRNIDIPINMSNNHVN
ncbi:hypothetical protein Scep_024712 [Stephania cephalantha]|uniref:Uncharacterized protein n=1 Tax=Stephania cephalantha TaxID=152367 RepID=A0AAP0F2L6_9MAGN